MPALVATLREWRDAREEIFRKEHPAPADFARLGVAEHALMKLARNLPPTWKAIVKAAQERMGRELTLDELLAMAKDYKMTPEEIEEQRQSWTRQDMD